MKRFAALVAVVAIIAMPLAANAGANCGAKAKTASTSCSAKTTDAKTVSNTSCASKAEVKTASNSSCSSKAAVKTASNASCASKATAMTASNASCATKTASVYCGTKAACGSMTAAAGDCCKSTNVIYRVANGDNSMETFVWADADAFAKKNNSKVEFVAAGNTFESQNDARMHLTKAIYERINGLTTVAYSVNGETMHCAKTASEKASHCDKTNVMYQVANRTFESKDAAETFKAKVVAAMEAVALIDANGKAVEGCAVSHCSKTAEGKVEKAAPTSFVVAGKTIADPFEANLVAAQERLRAILSTDA